MTSTSRLLKIALAFPCLLAAGGSNCLPQGTQSSGAVYLICMPDQGTWNGSLVLYAHGYTAFNEPIAIPPLTLPDGTSIPQVINGLGYGFAVSSFSVNGLAILQGVSDTADLVGIFQATIGPTKKVYLVGASEGGLVTALSIEQFGQIYNAVLPTCGPIGSFQAQIDYFGNFRVLFDYFFPGVIPGSPVNIPAEVINDWNTVYVPKIQAAITADPASALQLLKVAHASGSSDPTTVSETIQGILWYNTYATNDAETKLGGQPFDNQLRVYTGSDNDVRLNTMVERFAASPAARAEVAANYETTGKLPGPVVTLHNTGDPIVPFWHEPIYQEKVNAQGSASLHKVLPVPTYGHCNFTTTEVLIAFALMVLKDSGQALPAGAEMLVPENQRTKFLEMARELRAVAR